MTRGVHTNTMPLGLVYIARYLEKKVDADLDIRIFKDVNKVLKELKTWNPDLLGLAQYVWNSELNHYIARIIKKLNSNCVVVAGGPNLELSKEKKEEYLIDHPYIDICASYEGEIPFKKIVERMHNEYHANDSLHKHPVAGAYALDPDSGEVVESKEPPPRLTSLDVIGPIYADGYCDQFLDDGFHPFIQTHRGCPFSCTFCHNGNSYYSKMLFLSARIFKADMEYLGKRFSDKPNVPLYIANTNMSLFDQDFEIARIIKSVQDQYRWPYLININSGKNPERLLKMMSLLEFTPSIALQTLTSHVLEEIKRKNISFDEFIAFQKKVSQKTGKISSTELILSLPGETKQSFINTLQRVLNSDIQNVIVYTLMSLKGTPISSDESRQRFAHGIRYRIVPNQFSEINGKKIFETESVVVESDTMSYDEYLELRGLSFVIKVFFSSAELIPLKRFLREYKIDVFKWVQNLHQSLPDYPDIHEIYKAFMAETEAELFPSSNALINFYSQPGNWNALTAGKYGENLLKKYMMIVLYHHYDSYLEAALREAKKLTTTSVHLHGINSETVINSMHKFLSCRGVKQIVENRRFRGSEFVHLQYDIPGWLRQKNCTLKLGNCKKPSSYQVVLDEKAKQWIQNFAALNRDNTLSMQNLFHEEGIDQFWPAWILDSANQDLLKCN